MSSLLSGSPLSFPPSAITAIVPSLDTHGTKQWTPSCCQWLTSSTVKRRIGERLVEVDGLAAADAAADAGGGVERRQGAQEPDRARRHEVARRLVADRRQQQAHAIEDQRVDDAIDQPLAEPLQVEVGVQLSGERHEGAAVVIAIAVVGAIEQRLDGVLDQRRQQHHDQRREHRHDRVRLAAGVGKDAAGELQRTA